MVTLRLGLTMREDISPDYGEVRDALARDWAAFMAVALPEAAWLPVPNLGDAVATFAEQWDLDGYILTGGNSLGQSPLRDRTEQELLAHAMRRGQPVLGVCRGMQLVQHFFAGALAIADPQRHTGARHCVRFLDGSATVRSVNSYHHYRIEGSALAPALEHLALADDAGVEAVRCRTHPILCLQWHPERERPADLEDIRLVRRLYGLEP